MLTKVKITSKKAFSMLLAVLMIVASVPLMPVAFAATIAVGAINDVVIAVPETIYLKASTGLATEGQYYVNNIIVKDANGKYALETEASATEDMAYVGIAIPGATKVSYTVTTVTSGVGDFAANGEGNVYEADASGFVGSKFETGRITGAGVAAGSTALVRWAFTVTFSDGSIKTYYAYSVLYAPYYFPVGAGASVRTKGSDVNNTKVWSQNISWISGVHGYTAFTGANSSYHKGNNYAKILATSTDNDKSLVPLIYPIGLTNGEYGVTRWITTTQGSNTLPQATFRHSIVEGENEKSAMSEVSPTATITIDTSRYSNFSQIPNLTIGFMVTDVENAEDSYWYFSDYTDVNDSYVVNSHETGDIRTTWWNSTGSYIDGSGSNKDTNRGGSGYYANKILYNGGWNRAIKGSSSNYVLKGASHSKRSNDAFANTYVRLSVTNVSKSYLRNEVISSVGFSKENYTDETWNAYDASLQKAAMLLGKPDATQGEFSSAISDLQSKKNALVGKIFINATANGGTTDAPEYITVNSGANATATFNAGAYSAGKVGCTFLGWNTDKNATVGYRNTMSVPVGATVYAIFSINSYTVNFVNSITKQSIKTQSVNYGTAATAPEVEKIVRNDINTHYEFQGWDKDYSNVTAAMTVNTIYNAVEHTYELTNETEATCNKTGSKLYTCSVCGQTKTETLPIIPDNHKTIIDYPAKESTCTVPGYTAYKFCRECSKVISGKEPLPLAEHTWGEWSESTATCTQNGTSTRTCSVCKRTEVRNDAATGHNWGDWKVITEVSCTVAGREQRECSVCGDKESHITNATGHSYESVVTDPTCEEQGYTTHTCPDCGDSYVDTYVEKLGHDWEDVGAPTVEATCTTTGMQHQECTRCDATQDAVVEALGHDWTEKNIIKDATCTEDGLMAAKCGRCGEQQNEIIIPALGHSWDEGTVTLEPTCTTAGKRLMSCTVCPHAEEVTIPALGHAWGDGVVTKNASCTQEGEKFFECGNCEETKTEIIAKLPHNYIGVETQPTCTEQGYTTYTCLECGEVLITDYINAVGHANVVTVVPPTCTQQGYTVTKCLLCDNVERSDYVDPVGHKYVDTMVPPTCTEQGYTLTQCQICKDGTKKDFVDALGHEYGVTTVDPTCTEQGYDLHTCIRGDHSYMDNYTDAVGHTYKESGKVQATPTQSGYILYICEVESCKHQYKEIVYYNDKALVCITIYDTEGKPVTEATINVKDKNTGRTFVLTTDLNGYFTEVLPEGDYELVISRVGYEDATGYIEVIDGVATINMPEMVAVKCDCYCHKTDFISTILRIFAKIFSIFGIKHDCCVHSDV